MAEKKKKKAASKQTPSQMQLTKNQEAAAVRAISGGTDAEVQQAISTLPKPNLLPEVVALREEQAAAQAETKIVEQETAAEIAFQNEILSNINNLATGRITEINAPTPPPPGEKEDVVFKIAMQKLSEYGLSGIAESLKKARNDYPELEVTDLLFLVENDDRYNLPFKSRFKANELRASKGLPKLSARDYLALEQGYKKVFTAYNLPMFSNQTQYDKLIAGDVDVEDVTNRVVMAYDRVMTDTSTRNAFRQFYGTLTDSDIASALLDPTQQIPALEKKVMAAEVGGQALRQGLATSDKELQAMVTPEGRQVTGYSNVQRGTLGASALVGEGVTEASAAAGYERIAEQLPAAEKLSSIYAGRTAQVGQKELEQAEILGLESAKRKQRQLAGMEEATFSGQAGTMRTSLGRRGKQGSF